MCSIDKLTLISGIDFFVPDIGVNIHQPSIKEIAYIGEKDFFSSAEIFTMSVEKYLEVSKEKLSEEDKIVISQMSNFQLLMTVGETSPLVKNRIMVLLTVLFPAHMIELEERFIMLVPKDNNGQNSIILNEEKFSMLQDVAKVILCLNSGNGEEDFNPGGELAREIVEKLKRGREKAALCKGEQNKVSSLLSKYISALGIGTGALNIKDALNLTLYQLFNQIERFSLFEGYKISIQAKMAGAEKVEEVDWLKDIDK